MPPVTDGVFARKSCAVLILLIGVCFAQNRSQEKSNHLLDYHLHLRERRVKLIKDAILGSLNYDNPPNVTKLPSAEELAIIRRNQMVGDQPRGDRAPLNKRSTVAKLTTKYTFPVKEVFDLASPPAANVSMSADLVRNLTEAYYQNLTHHHATLSPEEHDDVISRIYFQQRRDLTVTKAAVFSRDAKARLDKKVLWHTDPPHLLRDHYRVYFHLHNMTEYTIVNATLYFYLQRPEQDRRTTEDYKYRVHIYKYLNEKDVDTSALIETHKILPRNGKWDSVNLTSLVTEWTATPWKNFGMMIRAEHITSSSNETNREELVAGPRHPERNKKNMFLEIQVKSQVPQNQAASRLPMSNDCTLEPQQYKNQCCRFPLKVDFESFGWDWIVAPKRYDAYYCAGGCSMLGSLTNSNHARLTQQMEAMFKTNGRQTRRGVGPCCSPQDMEEMNVIFVDHAGNVRNRKIPNMIVHRCGCR